MFYYNFTADGSVVTNAQSGSSGIGNFTTVWAEGTWGGGTLTPEISPDGENWFTVTDAALTADGFVNIQVKAPFIRLTLSGSSSPDLNVWAT